MIGLWTGRRAVCLPPVLYNTQIDTRLATVGHAQADRSLEALREELLEQGLLVKTPEVHIKDFLAAHSYAQRGQRTGDIDAEPSLLAIRNRLIELCVLPLVSALVRERWESLLADTEFGLQHLAVTLRRQPVRAL